MRPPVLFSLIATAMLASFAAAQDSAPVQTGNDTADIEAEEVQEQVEELEEVEEIDETGLDEQGFEDEDDDFRPTEDIPTDQSIPFPTDI